MDRQRKSTLWLVRSTNREANDSIATTSLFLQDSIFEGRQPTMRRVSRISFTIGGPILNQNFFLIFFFLIIEKKFIGFRKACQPPICCFHYRNYWEMNSNQGQGNSEFCFWRHYMFAEDAQRLRNMECSIVEVSVFHFFKAWLKQGLVTHLGHTESRFPDYITSLWTRDGKPKCCTS